MKRFISAVILLAAAAGAVHIPAIAAQESIVTDNVVELNEIISEEGFVHPGIGFSAESLNTMRDMVKDGVSPWVDYFEGMRRTKYAKLDAEIKKQEQIVNDGGINSFANDAQTAWVQAMLYFVTGNEEYRKIPVELIKWYGERKDFFPAWFGDSHIKLGKYVYTFCAAAELMRYTTPNDPSLAVTDEMIDKFDNNCLRPISDNSLSSKDYFMNQLNYAVQGYMAETILGDDSERYADSVEMTTVNAGYTDNPSRRGSIENVVRLVTADEETGEACEPHLQLAEMGRDQAHAKGNTDNFILISRTADIQKTKVDPEKGTVTDAENGVSMTKFLDDRIIKSAELFFEYNIGYDINWTPIYGENNFKDKITVYRDVNSGYRGRIMDNGTSAMYYRYKGLGYDLEKDYPMAAEAGRKVIASNRDAIYTGTYIDTIHNYSFDFWTGLDAAAADGEPDKAKAERALAKELVPYETTPSNIIEIENRFIDLNENADYAQREFPANASDEPIEQKTDADGTGYARVPLKGNDARTMVVYNTDMPSNKIGLRVRTEDSVELKLYKSTDYSEGEILRITAPDTGGEWSYVTLDFSPEGMRDCDRASIWYLTAQSAEGTDTVIDFDCINTSEDEVKPLNISTLEYTDTVAAIKGEKLEESYKVDSGAAKYSADKLPEGAALDESTGAFTWIPQESGDYSFTITAKNDTSVCAKQVTVKVRDSLGEAVEVIMSGYDENEAYTTVSKTAMEDAKAEAEQAGTQEALEKLRGSVHNLELMNPPLKYGGLDYVSMCTSTQGSALAIYADGTPENNATLSEPDMNFTMDFGNDYKIKSDHFDIQPRAGFPARVLDMNAYGSNDGVNWTRLTENGGELNDRMHTLNVYDDQKDKAYRYIRMYMPNGTNRKNENAYICDVGELRIYGERIEDYSPDYHKAYIDGYDDGTFKPDENMTRAEAAVLMSRTLFSYMDNNECVNSFEDVDENAWYTKDLAYMAKKKFITADADKNFRPEEKITRGEFCDLVMRVKGLKGDAESKFSDTAGNANENAIALAAQEGWIDGYDDGTFKPDAFITRAEIAAIVFRIEGRGYCGGENRFSDLDENHWAYNEITELASSHDEK